MKIYINNREVLCKDGATLIDVLSHDKKFNNGMSHVVLNGKLIISTEYSKTIIKSNDKIHILPIAMGG